MMNGSKNGFTLAEVLITLGIIGVVAAITIPTLIANTNSAKFRTKYQKAISTLRQAERMSQAKYDFGLDDADPTCVNPATDNPESEKTVCAILNGTLKGITYLGKGDTVKTANDQAYAIKPAPNGGYDPLNSTMNNFDIFALADGTIIGFYPGSSGRYGFIDVNGLSLPNQEVNCSDGTVKDVQFKSYSDFNCVVPNKPSNMTDIYPIIFNSKIEPATNAAEYVLNKFTMRNYY